MFINRNKNGELHQRNTGILQWFSLKCMKFVKMKTLNKKTREDNYENKRIMTMSFVTGLVKGYASQLVRFTIDLKQ